MTCPICENEPDQKYRPFCSRRCADIDLARWMSGAYAVPLDYGEEVDETLDASQNVSGKPH